MTILFKCLLLFLGLLSVAYAQTQPSNLTPGAIIQSNTQPWAIPQNAPPESGTPTNRAPQRDQPDDLSPVELEQPGSEKPISSELLIEVRDIQVEGVTLLSNEAVEKTIKPYRNRELAFNDIQTLAETLTQLYVQAGFVNSQVYIPPQTLQGHTLRLKALEVKVGEIHLEEGTWFKSKAILPRLSLKPGDPLNLDPLIAGIRWINENPDLKVQARLEKGKSSGSTDVVLSLKEQFPLHLTPFWDNLGRKNIGIFRYGLTATHNNMLGLGDTNTTSVSLGSSSFGLVNQYALPVGAHGTSVGLNYAYSKVKLGGALKPLDIRSSAHIFSPLLRQTLWHSARGKLAAEIAFDFKNLNTDLADQPFHRDRLRVLRPGFNGFFNDRSGRTYLNQEFGIGLNVLGGSEGNTTLASKTGSGTRFFSMTGGLTRVQKLPWNTTGVLRGNYQYSPSRLVSAEQFQLGGAYSVRGYSEGRQIGDRGYGLSAELYVPAFLLPEKVKLPFMKRPLGKMIQVVGFGDFGQLVVNRPVVGEIPKATMLGVGVGLRIQLTRFLVGRVDVGFPLIRQGNDENRARLHFGLQSNLF
ncbi:ShlB/FhaC/HecB family hemolysin secretion/activation protein [Vampirovibrio sp.]|uniref:ShlB/FhaC/HecB family hemolysin secretion/activation protein n=1 Tax=Vampirovibrio sp. TaxID=2717857 RepID=UPI00359411E4